jgi:enamine deaminase RidA (YjgF/YER057c/UK114 family)
MRSGYFDRGVQTGEWITYDKTGKPFKVTGIKSEKSKTNAYEMKKNRRLISSGSSFEERIGYSRAVEDGDWIFVSGTTGYNYKDMTISEDIVTQTSQCLKNIEDVLRQADSSMEDIVRVLYILPDSGDFEKCWPVLKECFGEIRPAATMISAGLADKRMKIEIQVTAKRR